ncbi:MAG: carbohydrate-binding family 9-like protein [Acidobacteria bacterium]|nr:carbohydrate-binding family 9-like protein [Acidobacteriota bacterium]
MNNLLLLALTVLAAYFLNEITTDDAKTIKSSYIKSDFTLTADPGSPHWKNIKGVIADRGPRGNLTPGHRTEVRSVWSDKNLYFLFICPYEEFHLRSNPSTTTETNRLWEWDVAEVFIGTNFENIKKYTEFQVSPQGEWVDLEIDRGTDPPNHNWGWNSGFEVKAKVESEKKLWYGEMRIPMEKIDSRKPQAGNIMRINFYRLQGPPPNRKHIAWQPTNADNYHVPEAFGVLKLEK